MARRNLLKATIAAVCLAAGCSTGEPAAPAAPAPASARSVATGPITPAVSINAMMVALVDHAAHNLWEIERAGKAPKSDADWANVIEHAIQIAAAGAAITAGGAGPTDAVWAGNASWSAHAARMAEAGVAARKAADSKNLDAVIAANGQLVQTCEACHKEFKPALPTEGIVHGHPH